MLKSFEAVSSEIPNAESGGIHMTRKHPKGRKWTIKMRRFQRCYYVYILANLRGALYVGLTDELGSE